MYMIRLKNDCECGCHIAFTALVNDSISKGSKVDRNFANKVLFCIACKHNHEKGLPKQTPS